MPHRTPRYQYLTLLIFLLASILLAACTSSPGPTPTAVPTLGVSVAEDTATPEPAAQAEPTQEESETPAQETPATEPEVASEAETEGKTTEETPAVESESVAFNSWTVEQLYGVGTLGGVPVTAEFISASQLTGWTGCNDYAATFQTGDGDSIQVTELSLTSDNPCRSEAAANQELLLQKALSDAASFALSGADLTLLNAAGEPVLTMRNAAVLTLIDTSWAVTGYDDTQGSFVPVIPEGPALTLNLRQNAINGFSGCNNFTGVFEASGDSISIGITAIAPAGTGSASCEGPGPFLDQEAAYRNALSGAVRWEIDGPHLTLFSEDGSPALTFIAGSAVSGASE